MKTLSISITTILAVGVMAIMTISGLGSRPPALAEPIQVAEQPSTRGGPPEGQPLATIATDYDVPAVVDGRQHKVPAAKSNEEGTIIVFNPLELKTMTIRQGAIEISPPQDETDLSKVIPHNDEFVVIDFTVNDHFSNGESLNKVLEAVKAETKKQVTQAKLIAPISATLVGKDEWGRDIRFGMSPLPTGLGGVAAVRWRIEKEQVPLLRSQKTNDLRVGFEFTTHGEIVTTDARVIASCLSESMGDLRHFINTQKNPDIKVVVIPIGDKANVETNGISDFRSHVSLKIQYRSGVPQERAEKLAELVLNSFLTNVTTKEFLDRDMVVFYLKEHVLWATKDQIRKLKTDDLETLEKRLIERKHEKNVDGKKSVNMLGIVTAEAGGGEEMKNHERDELLKTLRHLKRDFEGELQTLPAFSVKQLKSIVTKTETDWIATMQEFTAGRFVCQRFHFLPAGLWPASQSGWRISQSNGGLTLVVVRQNRKVLDLTDEHGGITQADLGRDGRFQAWGVDAIYNPDDSITWFGKGYQNPPTNQWLSHHSKGAFSIFKNRGHRDQPCMITLANDESLIFTDEHGRTSRSTFNPVDPRHGFAWGIPFENVAGFRVNWPGGFWLRGH